jgi:hypothetical protein
MALFDKQPEIPREKLKEMLKKSDIKIGQGKGLSDRQKESIESRDFPKKFGASINHSEYTRTINRMRMEKANEHDFAKKAKMGKELKFLQEIEKKGEAPK